MGLKDEIKYLISRWQRLAKDLGNQPSHPTTQGKWSMLNACIRDLEDAAFEACDGDTSEMRRLDRLKQMTYDCSDDMYNPGAYGVTARVVGTIFDNANGDSEWGDEILVLLTKDGETERFNLASLIALARKARVQWDIDDDGDIISRRISYIERNLAQLDIDFNNGDVKTKRQLLMRKFPMEQELAVLKEAACLLGVGPAEHTEKVVYRSDELNGWKTDTCSYDSTSGGYDDDIPF